MVHPTTNTQSAVSIAQMTRQLSALRSEEEAIDKVHSPVPTASSLNDHIANGGIVQVTTYGRSTVYEPDKGTFFKQGADGDLYVRRGRCWDCLTGSKGTQLMVSIRTGHYK